MFCEEIARFSEKPPNGRFFVVCLRCRTRWRAFLLMGICGPSNGSSARYERLSFVVGVASEFGRPHFFYNPAWDSF